MKVPDACGMSTLVVEYVTTAAYAQDLAFMVIPCVQTPLIVWTGAPANNIVTPSFYHQSTAQLTPDAVIGVRTISLHIEIKSTDTVMNTKGSMVLARAKPSWGIDINLARDRRIMSTLALNYNTLLSMPNAKMFTMSQGARALAAPHPKFLFAETYPSEVWGPNIAWGPSAGGFINLDTNSGGLVGSIQGVGSTSYMMIVRHCVEMQIEPGTALAVFSSPNTSLNVAEVNRASSAVSMAPVAQAIGTVVSMVAPLL